ncbi:MAG: PBP1A family penicillin-binding protein [Deltaproteobacteria bacterium]|nr:PBP1A family penicillin-binding protein [Deltaproteobacteria bacterium]
MRRRVVVANARQGSFLYWLLKFYLFGFCLVLAATVVTPPVTYLALAAKSPPVPNLDTFQTRIALPTRIIDAEGTLLLRLAAQERDLVAFADIPPLVVRAFVAAEDRSFYQHRGVDLRGIIRAALVNLRAGNVRQGGSTITQQVAKTFVGSERTIRRKLREIVLARRLETRFSKNKILEYYLNQIFLGSRSHGIKAAAKSYFAKSLDQLSPAEAAMLAGLARAPSRYSPRRSAKRALWRRNQVLKQLRLAGYLDPASYQRALAEPLRIVPVRRSRNEPRYAPYFVQHVRNALVARVGEKQLYQAGWRISVTADLALTALARLQVLESTSALDQRQGFRGPVERIHTADARSAVRQRLEQLYNTSQLQPRRPYLALVDTVNATRATAHIGDRLVEIPRKNMRWAYPYSRTNSDNQREEVENVATVLKPGDLVWVRSPVYWRRPVGWGAAQQRRTEVELFQLPRVEGALYHYDHQSGYVMAMVGGLDYDRSSFDRTTQACRQPGSAYKPVFYSLALDGDKYSMGSILKDKPYTPEPGEAWNPQNVHGTIDGKVTFHMSLVRSLNLPAVRLVVDLGPKQVADWARRLGFTTPIHADKALALGASCTRTDELTRSFATFVRGGSQRDPIYLRQIHDRDGRLIVDHTAVEDPLLSASDRLERSWATATRRDRQVIDEKTAFLMTKLLRDSVTYGIAARCRIVPVPTGGKGGTSSDTMDTWFVGFTGQWVATAWIGDDSYSRPLGTKEASYTTAIPFWANYMRAAVGSGQHGPLPIKRPAGLQSAEIDYETGGPVQPGKRTVKIYFKPGTFPDRSHGDHQASADAPSSERTGQAGH